MSNARLIRGTEGSDLVTFTILSDGDEIPRSIQILTIDISSEANRIPSATLVIIDGDAAEGNFSISSSGRFDPGKKLQIRLGYNAEEETLFTGIVIRQSIRIRENTSQLIVECRDAAVKLTSLEKSGYFLDQKDSEVITALVEGAGLEVEMEGTTEVHKELVRYQLTDWDFILTRADLNGLLAFTENGKISFRKPDFTQEPVLTAVYGSSLLEFDAEIDARASLSGVIAASWDMTNQEITEYEASISLKNEYGNLSSDALAEILHAEPLTIRHPGDISASELQHWANARLQKAVMAKARGRARFQGTSVVKPGSLIGINGVGEHFEGNVFVSGVRHQVAQGNWTTHVQFGLDPEWFAARASISGNGGINYFPTLQGLHTGVVTALENDPAREERIRVRLPLIDPDSEGIWCRVSTLDAGYERGSFFRPEIGDEVTVGFIGGDPRQPVVLGMLHSSTHPAPYQAEDENHLKGFVSRSGIRWTFDDDKKVFTLETPAGNKIRLSDDESGIVLADQHGNEIILNNSGISMVSKSALRMQADTSLEVKAQTITQQSASSLSLEGNSGMKLKSSGIMDIQGSLVKIN